jgi:hypothetical protein
MQLTLTATGSSALSNMPLPFAIEHVWPGGCAVTLTA